MAKLISKEEMRRRFEAFEMAYRELNDGWTEYDTSAFGEDYPFDCHDGDFGDIGPSIIDWCATSIRNMADKKFEDMIKTRECKFKVHFERQSGIETDFDDCQFVFVYFDSFYIGICNDGRFRLVLQSNEVYAENLITLERMLWEDFLRDEINAR